MRTFPAAAIVGLLVTACADTPTSVPRYDALPRSAAGIEVLRVPEQYPTIQSAVNAATPGAIIQVSAGTYGEQIVITTPGLRLHGRPGTLVDGSGLGGIGIHILGSAAQPLPDVEVAGFEVANFERGIVAEWASNARIHRNDVHHNVDLAAPLVLGEASGIELVTTTDSEVSQNTVHHNGEGGVQIRLGATRSLVRGNRIFENGTQRMAGYSGRGILITGGGTIDNQLLENEINGNYGRGIMIARPNGTDPIGGNVVAQNRLHHNYRSGVSLMGPVAGNTVVQNDARDNNLSGLAPCYRCNLVDLSVGGNTWERNLGSFNLTDPSCLQ